ncbi:hypothetical protein D9M72_314110 [compost metagenome]
MELDEPCHCLDGVVVEAEGLHPFLGQFGTHHVVVAEAHRAARFKTARSRLADVVHEGRKPQHKIGAGHCAVGICLQGSGLLQHLEGVLVDILVPVVFVRLQAQGGHFRQDEFGQAGVHEEVDAHAGVGSADELHQFLADTLRGNDADPFRHLRHCVLDVPADRHAELGGKAGRPHHAQGVIGKGRLRCTGRGQHGGVEVAHTAEGVDQFH